MISINVHLACDRCKDLFKSRHFQQTILRSDIEAMRKQAHGRGWRRFRLVNTGPNGDYCPSCQKKIAKEKAREKAKKEKAK